MKKTSPAFYVLIAAFLILDGWVWYAIYAGKPFGTTFHFLDVGQGDGILTVLDGVKILTDAGPDAKVSHSLEAVMPPGDRYIDLAVITHPQLDHFNGFNDILKRYRVGAFLFNGRTDAAAQAEWKSLMETLKQERIPIVTVAQGDRVRYGKHLVAFLSPSSDWLQSGELNDTSLVQLIATPHVRALLTADIGTNLEEDLIAQGLDLRADILKIGHHGSKYSSSAAFLRAVDPRAAVIQVGKNRYGHPAPEVMGRLERAGIPSFRTDMSGTLTFSVLPKELKVFSER